MDDGDNDDKEKGGGLAFNTSLNASQPHLSTSFIHSSHLDDSDKAVIISRCDQSVRNPKGKEDWMEKKVFVEEEDELMYL
ncbi:hypothetical protein ZIOFF_013955 [Zingiber officinale]|uniref:Uncharacterized protein n=1 Tax=Zingiber officinale TaxID=94328 RepID=A0A8J5H9X7_ZINOF|nr:hypothetical protein ZIOFF_013955 [Zingiber officinale]